MEMGMCIVTGHRLIPEALIEYVSAELDNSIKQAIEDGYTCFMSGFADGVDMYFARLVLKNKLQYPNITLEAAIPYLGRYNALMDSKNPQNRETLQGCDRVHIMSKNYFPKVYMERNRFMVQRATRVIAVYDGRRCGGTFYTIRLAQNKRCDVQMILV